MSAEFVLSCMPNGGAAILLRTFWISGFVYATALFARCATDPGYTTLPIRTVLLQEVHDSIVWFGAIFGGVYLALYARFSAQWTYLAGLYNDIMSACVCTGDQNEDQSMHLAYWQAAFIDDAVALHLATKPSFAVLIYNLLEDDAVRAAFADAEFGSNRILEVVETKVRNAVAADLLRQRRKLDARGPAVGRQRLRRPSGQ